MASTKLTNHLRDHLERAMLSQRFSEAEAALNVTHQEIGDAVYNTVFSAKDRELMLSLPQGWLPKEDSIKVRIAGKVEYVTLPTPRCMPQSKYYSVVAVFDGGHKIAERWLAYQNATADIKTQRCKLRRQISAVLHSVNTTKQLLEVWPEAGPFLKDEQKPTPQLPSLRIDELNAALGLTEAA